MNSTNVMIEHASPRIGIRARWDALAPILAAFATHLTAASSSPPASLPADLEVVVAAAHPLVNYPILGCIDDRGRLFLGDSAGVNLDKKQLEAQLPNRITVLEDTDGDGIFDRTAVFADKLTFPSGGFWLDGSLYFASPPGIWRFTDSNGDSVADRRELVVGGFDGYTGNGTHIHSPVLNPADGRMYWCVGGTGGNIVQKDGTPVRNGRVTGVWSARTDGSDIQWHALGAMANPVEVDFTPEGAIVGTMNILYLQPRGDTLLHWLQGGVYERADLDSNQRHAGLADLPHTLEKMPVLHNFGHVAVSGMMRYRSGALNPNWKDNLFVAFFNTQKIVRVQLAPSGATYSATQHEFLKLDDPWMHLTDVMEDADGSLLVLDSGGWFSRGCPSSLGGNAEVRGAVYRVRAKQRPSLPDPYGHTIAWSSLSPGEIERLRSDKRWMVRERATRLTAEACADTPVAVDLRAASTPPARLRALETIARARRIQPRDREVLLELMAGPLEPALEHAALYAGIATQAFDLGSVRAATTPILIRRLSMVVEQSVKDPAMQDALAGVLLDSIDSPDPELSRTAIAIIGRNPRALEVCQAAAKSRLALPRVSPGTLALLAELAQLHLAKPGMQELVTEMLIHNAPAARRSAWRILARQPGHVSHAEWHGPLAQSLSVAEGADLALLLEVIGKVGSDRYDEQLRRIITSPASPQPLRLRAVAALSRPGRPLSPEAFTLLMEMAGNSSSPAARIDAARFLTRARLSKEQLHALTPIVGAAGPVELQEYLRLKKAIDPENARLWAAAVAKSPVLGSLDESVFRSGFQALPARTYEEVLGPAVRAAAAAQDQKRRSLETLSAEAANGRASEGRKVFESSACIACHTVGELGRAIGPDLSHIGKIRVARNLLGKILFPNDSVSQGYETFVIETSDGQSFTGAIKSETAEGISLVDLTGQSTTIPPAKVVGRTALPTSLMPVGLEQTMSRQQLLDLVAWLTSLK